MVILSRPLTFDVRRDGKIQGDPPGRRKARRAFSVVAFASSSAGRARRRGSSAAGSATYAGSLGFSPGGTGARKGQTVSTQDRAHGARPAPARHAPAFPKGGKPEKA